eukprot:7384546-Prymnesium_polylepis.2
MPGFGTDTIELGAVDGNGDPKWANAAEGYRNVIAAIETRPYASFLCAIKDAPAPDEWIAKCILSSRATSDSCTNPKSGNPYVFGHLNGAY